MEFLPIQGDYSEAQLTVLIDMAKKTLPLEGKIIEIGCWKGRSAAHLCHAIYPENLVAVDTWQGNIDEQNVTKKLHPTVKEASVKDVLEIFKENMDKHTKGNYEVNQMDCFDFIRSINFSIKFCHIDASHDYESVKKTIEKILPHVVEGGILCGDDISSANERRKDLEGGVERAVKETLPGFRRVNNFWWWKNESL